MDLEEWEVLSNDGLFDSHPRVDKRKISKCSITPDFRDAVDMNYFICPSSQKSQNPVAPITTKKFIPENNQDSEEFVKDIVDTPIKVAPPAALIQDAIFQVFFKNMEENKFVDMKSDFLKSDCRGDKAQFDLDKTQLEEKEEAYKDDCLEEKATKVLVEQEQDEKYLVSEVKEQRFLESHGLNLWRWGVSGIGALCSMGVAAAATCVVIFGSLQRPQQHLQNHRPRVHIFAEDKSIKKVGHNPPTPNQALSSLKGVPLTKAHIRFGGYYNGF